MSETNSPEQETHETKDVTPEESGAAVVPETEETANATVYMVDAVMMPEK